MHKLFLASLFLSGGALAHAQNSSPSVSVASTRVIEGNSGQTLAQFRVILSSPSNTPVSLSYETVNGSAKAGEDYVATRGTLTIPAKLTTGTFSVPVLGDTKIEGDETFSVNVSGSGYSALSPAAYGIIVNDDRPAPTPQPLGKIVFTSRRDGSNDIFAMNGDGTNQTNLTSSPNEEDGNAVWSPDGHRIAFSSYNPQKGRQIYVMNADGTKRFAVPQPQNGYNIAPQWGPGGQRLVFISMVTPVSNESDSEIYTTPASATGTAVNISRNSKRQDFSPQWSPDGKQIIWDSSLTYQNSQVVVAPADGSGKSRALTGNTGAYAQPQWSPNGRKIAYTVRSSFKGYDDVYVMNTDGRSQINLTRTDNSSESHPVWSRDSTRLTFRVGEKGKAFVVATNAIGEKRQQLSKDTPYPDFPQWDPYNSRVAFVTLTKNSRWEIYSAPATSASDGSTPSTKLTDDASPDEGLDWAVGSVPPPTLTASDPLVYEGNSGQKNATFLIGLSAAAQKDLTVTFSTIGITAKPVEDYIPKNGTFVIRAKTRTATVSIPIVGDTKEENNETFGLRLSAPGYKFKNPAGICTIKNDDNPAPRPTSEPTPVPTPSTSGKIAYVANPDDGVGGEIYVMNADGSNQTRLTSNTNDDYNPMLSADGKKITFYGAHGGSDGNVIEIYSMNADGTNVQQLTDNDDADYSPSFSPDASQIVFISNRNGNYEIYTMNADGTNQKILTTNGNEKDHPVFSPDGSQIAFFGKANSSSQGYQLFIMNADGTDIKAVTTPGYSDANPVFSHDGQYLVFASDRTGEQQILRVRTDGDNLEVVSLYREGYSPSVSPDDSAIVYTAFDSKGTRLDVYTMNADGTGSRQLTTTGARTPSWSVGSVPPPPGTSKPSTIGKITFTSLRDGSFEIYVMNADGSNQTRLTNDGRDNRASNFSADGSKIVFMSARDGNFEIYTMNADGSNQTRLTKNDDSDENPVFSPDGSKVVFSSSRDGNSEIYTMNADGSNQTRLTKNTTPDVSPTFSPDGTRIVYWAIGSSNFSLGLMNADGTNQTTIPTRGGPNSSWSSDGSKIALNYSINSDDRIVVINPDGTGRTQITNGSSRDSAPSFSPDSSSIAFMSNRDSQDDPNLFHLDIYAVTADGSSPTRLTTQEGRWPSWARGSVPAPSTPATFKSPKSPAPSGSDS